MGDPGTWPEFYYEHDIWQYSVTGIVPGIEGYVDMDVMYVRTQTEPAAPVPTDTEPAEETEAAG